MRIGIDLGGSHIGVGLVDSFGKIILKKEKDLLKEEKHNISEAICDSIKIFIDDILKEKNINLGDIEFIGIAFPAALRNGKIGLSGNLGINGYEIEEYLKECYKIPVYIRNDAKCAAICEKEFGSLNEYENAVFLTIGTGIGGAIFIDNKLITIKDNDTFEIGHMVIKKDGLECKCGRNGCFEQYASIRALKNNVIEKYSLQDEITGLELHDFIIKNLNDDKMQEIINDYLDNLVIGILNIIELFQPEAISLGGSFAYYEDIFLNKLNKKLNKKLNNESLKININCPKILIATSKNDAGIIGASIL